MTDADRGNLTAAQTAVWTAHAMQPDIPLWSVPLVLGIGGRLDRAAFARAFRTLVESTDSLRMVVRDDNGFPRLEVDPGTSTAMQFVDLSGPGREAFGGWLRDRVAKVRDPRRGHFDHALVKLGDADYAWFMNQHHLFTDDWSNRLVLRTLSRLYLCETGEARERIDPFPTLLDRIEEIRQYQQSDAGAADRRYFAGLLNEDVEPIRFFGTQRGSTTSMARESHRLDTARTRAFRDRATQLAGPRREAASASHFHLAAAILLALLHRVSGRQWVSIGSAYHNRQAGDDRRATALLRRTPGLFADVVPIVIEIAPSDSFAALVNKVRDGWAGAVRHAPGGTTAEVRRRACDVAFNYLAVDVPQLFGAATELTYPETGHMNESLAVRVSEGADRLLFEVDFNADVFAPATRPRVLGRFLRLLDACLEDPARPISAISLLLDEEAIALETANRTEVGGTTDTTVTAIVENHVRRRPSAPALEGDGEQLSYAELDRRATLVATALRARGVRSETLVAVAMERSVAQIVALLGIHKASGAYLPVDPTLPAERIARLLDDAAPALVLTKRALERTAALRARPVIAIEDILAAGGGSSEAGSAERNQTEGHDRPAPSDLAYVIYTSGSTGAPKGVEVAHASLANLARFIVSSFELTPSDRVLQFNALSFDFSVEEIFSTFAAGATLVLRTDAMIDSADAFLDACLERRVTVLGLPTAFWHTLVGVASSRRPLPETVRLILLGGEAVRPEMLEQWQRWVGSRVRLINGYGPTETTVGVTFGDLTGRELEEARRGIVSIGGPCWNAEAYVVDNAGHPVGPGFAGELYIGGKVLGRGYRHDPALTASRFVPHPLRPGERVYRTGDRVRWRDNGELEYLGRLDQQVKIRGYRVEPGEIEARLRTYPGVKEAIVVATAVDGETRLAAYAGTGDAPVSAADLRASLAADLPAYMVPSAIVCLPALPRAASGKVNRAALPAAETPARDTADAPRTANERTIAAIFAEELRVDRVGLHDSFFDLGGHSLLGIRVVARLTEALGQVVPVRLLFDRPTVAALAAAIGTLPAASPIPAVPRERRPAARQVP